MKEKCLGKDTKKETELLLDRGLKEAPLKEDILGSE